MCKSSFFVLTWHGYVHGKSDMTFKMKIVGVISSRTSQLSLRSEVGTSSYKSILQAFFLPYVESDSEVHPIYVLCAQGYKLSIYTNMWYNQKGPEVRVKNLQLNFIVFNKITMEHLWIIRLTCGCDPFEAWILGYQIIGLQKLLSCGEISEILGRMRKDVLFL